MLIRLLLCLLLLPSTASAVTLIAESDFEGAHPENDGWLYTASYCTSSPCSYLDYSTDVAHSGTKSLKGTYNAAWSDPNPQINTAAIYKGFAPQQDVYVRYWYRTAGFTYNIPSTKHIYYKGAAGYPNGGSVHYYGSREFAFFLQNTIDCGTCWLLPNLASKPIADNQWVCVEEHFKMNTVGAADGAVELWIDGVQTIGYYNRTFRGTVTNGPNQNSSAMLFDDLEIFKQNGNGSMYYDQFAAATTRIGCGAGAPPPPTDTTPPATPTALAATNSSGGTVSLSWTAPSDTDLAGYTIRRCQGSSCSPVTQLTTLVSPATSFVDSTVSPTTTYNYSINAYDTTGNQSAYSTAVQVTTATTYRTTLQTDTWARADNTDLGASYTGGYTGQTTAKIVSQRMLPTTLGTDTVEEYTGVTTPNDQWCSQTIGTLTGANSASIGCFLRLQAPSTYSGYRCLAANASSTNKAALRRVDSGGINVLASDTTAVWQTGDVMLCQMVGTALKQYQVRNGVETLLLSATDATYASGVTGVYASASVGGALTDAQSSMFAMGGFSSSSTSAVAVDSTATSATTNLTNTISWTHNVGTGSNRLLKVCAYSRDEVASANVAVTSITANGLPLAKVRADLFTSVEPVYINTELWYLVAPGSGSQTITITWAGAPNRYAVGASTSYTGILQVSPLDANAGANGTSATVSTAITSVADNDLITDCAIGRSDPLTIGAGQTTETNFNTTVFIDAMGASTVLNKTPAGAETMDWTQSTSSSYAISAAAFKAAAVTPVVAPTIATLSLDATGATLTHGATTSTTIRVVIGNNYNPTTQTVVEPIASFPAGRYTKTWPDGYDFVCFYPRDSLGVENTDPNASKCGSITGIVAAVDVTPIVMTQSLPGGTLNQGTTSTTIAVTVNKTGSCRYAATNIAFDSMSLDMANAGLVRSATVSGLTNGTTTHYYVHCRFQNTIGNDITTSAALDISVVVANSAPADSTAPSTVINLVGTSLSQSQIQLVWTAATDNVAVQSYQVYQDLTGACTTYSPVGVPVTNTFTVVNLPASTAVSYVVRAIDTSQNYSASDSNCVTITTAPVADTVPPSTMTNLAVVAYKGSLVVTFDTGTDNGTVLPVPSIEYCVGAGCTTFTVAKSGTGTTKYVTGLNTGDTVCVRGRFTDAAGNVSVAYSNVVCATVKSSGLVLPRQPLRYGVPRLPRS